MLPALLAARTPEAGNVGRLPRAGKGSGDGVSDDLPVHVDRERMERALAGPRFMVPGGLTPEEIVAYIDEVAEHIETGGCEVVLP